MAGCQHLSTSILASPAPIHEGPLAQRRCSFWAAGCGVIRAQGLAPHGLRVLEAARAPPGGVPSASGWVGPLDALQARHHPRPGVARVSPRYCYGIATVSPRCCSHVDGINMGATPGRYRGDTVEIPCLLAWGSLPGAAPGFSMLRKVLATAPLAGNRPGLFIFTTVSLAQQAGARPATRVDRGRGSKRSYSCPQA